MTSITIPESVTNIGNDAFNGCSSLTSIIIPEGVTSIGNFAFSGCSSLTSITIPKSVTNIGMGVFSNCSSLTSITIPESVTSIGDFSFTNCSSLMSIKVSEKNEVYDSRDNCNAIIETETNKLITGCSTTTIPESVTGIGGGAFSDCSGLISIVIPEGVTDIGGESFRGGSGLTSITIPEGVTDIWSSTFSGCSSLTNIILPESITYIGSVAFTGCSSLKSITIPKSVMSIVFASFSGCSSLTSIIIPESVTSIGEYAFEHCDSLTSITIPEGVTSIEEHAFYECDSLTSITIPESVTSIGDYALGYFYDERENHVKENYTIYGYSGTAAETYANENGFKFIELKKAESDEGIKVEYEKDLVADGADITLVTKKLAEGDNEYQNIVIADKILDENVNPEDVKFTAFDITLKDANGATVQPDGNITVKMLVPEGYNGNNCKVYHVNDKGDFTDMEAAYVNGFMVFETNHFSTYMITETELKTTPAVIFGDANSDGAVNSKDVVMLKKHLAGYKVDINLAACDVNGDGDVNSKDVVMVMKKLAGYDVVLGNKAQ